MLSPATEIKPVHNPVYTTADSLADVIFEAQVELLGGDLDPNRLRVLFGIYHNTLLSQLARQTVN